MIKVLIVICFFLALPLSGRQLGKVVESTPSLVYTLQNTSAASKQKLNSHLWRTADLSKADEMTVKAVAEKETTITSLFSYFLEPEFAGILLLVAIFGLSGMKHGD
jgi:hypothetical protein